MTLLSPALSRLYWSTARHLQPLGRPSTRLRLTGTRSVSLLCRSEAGAVVCAPKAALPSCPTRSYAAKKGDKKGKTSKTSSVNVDDLLDALDDEDDDEDESGVRRSAEDIPDTPAARFIEDWDKTSGFGKGKKRDKVKHGSKAAIASSHSVLLGYSDVNSLVPIEKFWNGMAEILEEQKFHFVHNLTVRSVNALDDIEVELEGDKFPLKEVANISKRDPKRLIIDTSTFPQATVTIMKALRSSSLILNPQQDGTRVYVAVPKVTKEHREKLAKAAKATFNESKAKMQLLQNKYVSMVGEIELAKSAHMPKEHFAGTNTILMAIEHHFVQLADEDCHKKQNDVMGHK